MKLLLLSLCFAYACASTPEIARAPASSVDQDNLANLLASPSAETDFAAYLNRLTGLYFRAEAELRDFDRELDAALASGGGRFLEKSKSYRRLIALWGLSHRWTDKIVYSYVRLHELRNGGEQKLLAKRVLQNFHRRLRSLRRVDRIAVHELIRALREAVNVPELPREKSDSELLREVQLRKKEIELRAAEEKAKDSYADEISAAAAAVVFEVGERSPQSQNVRPSPGPDGNLTGRTFPLNTWALTYDDGPHSSRSDAVLSVLRANEVKATFFELARSTTAMPEVVGRLQSAGMELANHSYTHAQLTTLDAEGLDREIVQSTRDHARVFGSRPAFFRCPYGAGVNNAQIRSLIADEGMVHVFWNVDTLDWQDKNPASIFERTKKQMQAEKRGVILHHDIHAQTVEATKLLMRYSKSLEGADKLRWVTMSEIVKELNGE